MERKLAYIALFAALIAALGLIPKITLGFGVPITAQTLGVMLCGTILGSRLGFIASALFIALVALGMPLLAGGRGGLGLFVSPSVGFLLGWPISAFITGLLMERLRNTNVFLSALIASILGCIVFLYIPGIVGIAKTTDLTIRAATISSLLFVPGDLIKAVFAGIITAYLSRVRPDSVISRKHMGIDE